MASEAISLPSRFGTTDDPAGTEFDIFLKTFSGEILSAFEEKTVLRQLIQRRTISSGKSAAWPVVGTASAVYHVPGQNILTEGGASSTYLSTPGAQEKIINVDHLLTSSVLMVDIDTAMSHYDVRGRYADEIARALANKYDLSLAQVIFNGAGQGSTLTGEGSWANEGVVITDADFLSDTTAVSQLGSLASMARQFDEREIPEDNRHIIVDPQAWHNMIINSGAPQIASSDYNRTARGDVGMGTVVQLAGFNIHKTNRLAALRALGSHTGPDIPAGQRGSEYEGTFTNCVGLAFHGMLSVATVQLLGLSVEHSRENAYQGDLMVAKLAVGHGVLHPEACGQIITS